MNSEDRFIGMSSLEFLSHTEIGDIASRYDETKKKKAKASYNLFTVSSYNSYLENFHSDIIASLLDPNEQHCEEDAFLQLFFQWLNSSRGTAIDLEQFRNTIVSREQGRLDIWLRDEKSRRSIIIENKMNNAPDMDDQLDRYFAHAKAHRFDTIAVLYLTLDGAKLAPPCAGVPVEIVQNVAAFTSTPDDMVNGWLRPCRDAATNEDSRSFIHQYIKLLEHLANKSMDKDTMESFYQFVSRNGGAETVGTIVEMASRLMLYRADKFAASITNYAPFKRHGRWKPTYLCYERYWDGDNELKLDVYYEDDGSAYLALWNTKVAGEAGRRVITEKLNRLDRLKDFVVETEHWNGNAYGKHFVIGSSEYPDMAAVDAAHIAFTKAFLADLRTL